MYKRQAIDIENIRENLYIITDFFSVLAGESVTINALNCVDCDKLVEVMGICNFPKEKLNILKNDTIDYTSFKRSSLYKITDFQNLEQADVYKRQVKRSKAYSILKQLNDELAKEGYVAVRGKIPRPYWETKFYGCSQRAV